MVSDISRRSFINCTLCWIISHYKKDSQMPLNQTINRRMNQSISWSINQSMCLNVELTYLVRVTEAFILRQSAHLGRQTRRMDHILIEALLLAQLLAPLVLVRVKLRQTRVVVVKNVPCVRTDPPKKTGGLINLTWSGTRLSSGLAVVETMRCHVLRPSLIWLPASVGSLRLDFQ